MAIKKEMSTDAPDTCIKLHLKPSDTVYDVYRKFNEAVEEVKNTPLNSEFDQTASSSPCCRGSSSSSRCGS